MASEPEVFSLDSKETEVNVGLFGPGNSGCNEISLFVRDKKPEDAPGFHLVALDTDGKLLNERFVPGVAADSYQTKARLEEWYDSGRLKVLPLREKRNREDGEGVEPVRKLLGTGGKEEVGKRIVQQYKDQIIAEMRGKNLIIGWGGGGGGTATSVLEFVADTAKELEIPSLSIVINPFREQGDKFDKALSLCQRLRERSKVLAVLNGNLPQEKENSSLSDIYYDINLECRIILDVLLEYTQVVGLSNADLSDFLSASEGGEEIYIGQYKIKLSDLPEGGLPDVDLVVERLLNHTYQRKGIKADSLLPCFRSPRENSWTRAVQRQIIEEIQKVTGFTSSGFIKEQVSETLRGDEMIVSLIAFGSFEEETSESAKKKNQGLFLAKPSESQDARRAKIREKFSGQPTTRCMFETEGSVKRVYQLPISLNEAWKAEIKNGTNMKRVLELAEQISAFDDEGVPPSIPVRMSWGRRLIAR